MLVLSRKLDEEIVIDEQIIIKVLHLGNGRVRLGIASGDNHKILRREVLDEEQEVKVKRILTRNEEGI